MNLRERLGINVVAVRSGGKTDALPTAETVIHEGDLMLVVASEGTLDRLNRRK